jgi:peptidoglycan/xylan/chitin deacetylase (PgdA/CDA1 family)
MLRPQCATARRVTALMYHRIGVPTNAWERKYCVDPRDFAYHMAALATRGMHACSLDEFIAWREGMRELEEGAFLLTFDDGFLDIHRYALPLLAARGWPATVFLVSALIGKTDEWCRRENPAGRTYPLLGRGEIREMMQAGFTFHSHSRTHADLTMLSARALDEEISGSRRDLEDMLGQPVCCFAYPYGNYSDAVVERVRAAGYTAAFSVQPGFNRRDVDPFRIRRLDVFGTDTASALARKVQFGSNDGSWRQTVR